MQNLDWILLAVCLGVAWLISGPGDAWFEPVTRNFARLACNKRMAILAVGIATLAMRLALLPWMPVPQPKVHDEFSYLLAADTFAHGRVANPPHPMWIFFDTFHVIQHPVYASMYPPAPGAALTLGRMLGHPWIGVLLATAAMCMAMTWMLQGWVAAEWALLGGVLVLFRFAILSYWMNSYWGGSLAATAAALTLGAFARILNQQRRRDIYIFGAGLAILATSRPVEGLIFSLPLLLATFWWTARDPSARRERARRILFPLFGIGACVLGFIAFYNWRLTGSPLVFPHLIEAREKFTTPIFLWEHDKPRITYTNPQFDRFFNQSMPTLYRPGWESAKGQFWWKASEFWEFFLGPALSIPFLALLWELRRKRVLLLLAQCALSFLGLWVVVFYHPHYAAPIMATVVLLLMIGMQRLHDWRWRQRAVGSGIIRVVVLFTLLTAALYFLHAFFPQPAAVLDWLYAHSGSVLGVSVTAFLLLKFVTAKNRRSSGRPGGRPSLHAGAHLLATAIVLQVCIVQMNLNHNNFPIADDVADAFRGPVEQRLAAQPGEHLVLVRYAQDHNPGEEYVYNGADLDHSKIVWAREIPGVDPQPLLDYFSNRKVWIFVPDEDNLAVEPYVKPDDRKP